MVSARYLALGLLAIAFNATLPLKFYPVLVNGALFTIFASSFVVAADCYRTSGAAQRTQSVAAGTPLYAACHPGLVRFFAVNGTVALITALWASARVWMLYNGFISYLLMGLLFAGEFWSAGVSSGAMIANSADMLGLLTTARPPCETIARRGNAAISFGEFLLRVGAWQHLLRPLDGQRFRAF